jgi:hypothetical protein
LNKKIVGILIVGLFIGASILPIISGKIKEDNKNDPFSSENYIIFEDDFNDDTKDYTKWTEFETDGQWWEQNQRTEFILLLNGAKLYEGIISTSFYFPFSSSQYVKFTCDMIYNIGSSNGVGNLYFEITDSNHWNWILGYYKSDSNTLYFGDSNDISGTILGTRDDGNWSNSIEVFSDKYKVTMDSYDSDWVYDSIFSPSSILNVKIYMGVGEDSPPPYIIMGFDNVQVEGITDESQPPFIPSDPTPGNHETDVDIDAVLSWTGGDPDGDKVKYDVYFEKGNPNPKLVSYRQSEVSYKPDTMNLSQKYYWRVDAIDDHGAATRGYVWDFKTVRGEGNQPPDKPSRPSGVTSGETGLKYSYSTASTDPEYDDVYYWFDWGDGKNSGWVGPYNSGDSVTLRHAWANDGKYSIKVKAKDIFDNESVWSDSLTVSMPKNKIFYHMSILTESLIQRFPILNKILNQII